MHLAAFGRRITKPPESNRTKIRMKESTMANEVNDKNFTLEVLQSDLPVLVDFWATWCGPCKSIGPIIDELSKEYAGRVKVAKLNVDENPATPGQYGVRSIPTLILFKGGKVLEQMVGAQPKTRLTAMIEKAF
jgi:thioredoxin 1